MKKRLLALLAALVCLAMLAACGGKATADSFSIHPDADGHGPETAESGAGGPSNANAESSSDPEELHFVTGIIDGAGMGDFYVMLDDGLVLAFPHEGADLDGLEDSMPGSPITVWYTGVVDGNDTSGATVVRMETPK